MKNLLLLPLLLCAVSATAQTAVRMDDLTPETKAAATELRLTGKLTAKGNSDFRQMRDLCWLLRSADLGTADCTAIPDNAFHSHPRLERILLPANAQSIGNEAFFACRKLRRLTLPANVASVGDAAFSQCEGLEEIVIEGAPKLGEFAFAGLKNLRSVCLLAAEPPAAAASAFEGVDYKRLKVSVPPGAEGKYRTAPGWRRLFGEAEPAANGLCDAEAAIIPAPAGLLLTGGEPLTTGRKWRVVAGEGLAEERLHAERILRERTGGLPRKGRGTLRLMTDAGITGNEGYTLSVGTDGITIKGRTSAGVFYGLMTLDCLLRGNGTSVCCTALPQLTVSDAPRTGMRELMVDPCRTFIPLGELKRLVPEMARYKLNALHLHLVDDQAWRIEIKKYPLLTELSSTRKAMDDMLVPSQGFYTQEEMRELVAYAAKYHVEVVPEIEMPGHEIAAIHAYPDLTCHARHVPLRTTCGVSDELLCPGKDFTYEFLGNVFAEMADVFPSPYVHLGGDEAGIPALNCWTDCPDCNRLKDRIGCGGSGREENWRLQEYLFGRIIDTLRTRHGKTPMFWYETDFKRIPAGCVTFAWRHGLTQAAIDAAVANNAKIMLCPGEHCYLDYPMAAGDMPEVNWGMPLTPLRRTYDLDPAWGMDEDFERNNLFGVAGTLWSECIPTPERISYQAYPRALALAEAGWSPAKVRGWEGFLRRLAPTLRDMARRGISYSRKF